MHTLDLRIGHRYKILTLWNKLTAWANSIPFPNLGIVLGVLSIAVAIVLWIIPSPKVGPDLVASVSRAVVEESITIHYLLVTNRGSATATRIELDLAMLPSTILEVVGTNAFTAYRQGHLSIGRLGTADSLYVWLQTLRSEWEKSVSKESRSNPPVPRIPRGVFDGGGVIVDRAMFALEDTAVVGKSYIRHPEDPCLRKRTLFYQDMDGDGWGSGQSVTAVVAPRGYVAAKGDCDDASYIVHPGARDKTDGIDNNCDGVVDD